VGEIAADVSRELRRLLESRALTTVFQPIYAFGEAQLIGFEALVRGPEGTVLQTPAGLFAAANDEGLAAELNVLCITEVLRAFSARAFPGSLFLNVSPQFILKRGFDRTRAERFLADLSISPERVVIELTEDYPAFDFPVVHESLMLYRSMGFRIAIDDLGEGFASLRLWSELRPEFVKVDKHFVTGVANDPVKAQFLRAIQDIAESAGSQVIAEGIETAADFKVVKDMGLACGQGWFIGHPAELPPACLPEDLVRAQSDAKLPVLYMPDGGLAEDFLHIAGLVQVSVGNSTMRPFVLVGIENTERRRDLTGPTQNEEDRKIAPRVGGSALFRKFLRGELLPEVKARYRTTDETAIVGESLAGLFVIETFLLEPDLFDTYIAIDPSLWWNDGALVKDAPRRLSALAGRPKTLYVAASRDDRDEMGQRFADVLKKSAPATLKWFYQPMPEETHATIYHPAALGALRRLFKP